MKMFFFSPVNRSDCNQYDTKMWKCLGEIQNNFHVINREYNPKKKKKKSDIFYHEFNNDIRYILLPPNTVHTFPTKGFDVDYF